MRLLVAKHMTSMLLSDDVGVRHFDMSLASLRPMLIHWFTYMWPHFTMALQIVGLECVVYIMRVFVVHFHICMQLKVFQSHGSKDVNSFYMVSFVRLLEFECFAGIELGAKRV